MTRVPWLAATAAAAALLAGCSGTSGTTGAAGGAAASATTVTATPAGAGAPASPSPSASPAARSALASATPAAILAASKAAFTNARTVHISGKVVDRGQTTAIDMRIKRGAGARGTIAVGGNPVALLRVGSVAYIKGSSAFYSATAGAPAARLLAGKYLKVSSTSKTFAALLSITDVGSFAEELFTPRGTVTKGAVTTVAGRRAIELRDGDGSRLYVSLQGPAYPLELVPPPSASAGQGITFADYGQAVALTPPPSSQVLSVPVP